ncbi:MAG TPA: hypothetical protein VJN70_09515 [Gemmatimonadaceae bacterium]|nr:hypothetical protein [Gemmatimonadaceae bacterium]
MPIPNGGGGTIDSGWVHRLGGDTIFIAEYSHTPGSTGHPGVMAIATGTWLGSQSGNIVVLYPLLASTQDTAFVGQADTLTRHAFGHVEVYVAP